MDVTAFPRGYQGLIGAQNQGIGIRQAADFMQPTVEVFDLLAFSLRGGATSVLNPLVAGATLAFAVPQQEYWLVRQVSLEVQTGVGEAVVGSTLVATDPQTNATSYAYHLTRGISQGASTRSIEVAYPGVIYGPGTQFGIRGGLVTGVPIALATILFERLKA